MIEYPNWMDDLRLRRDGESAGQHVARIVRGLVGVSLVHDHDRLVDLFRLNELDDRAEIVASMKTNCGTFMRQIWLLAGCDADLILCPYVVGMAVSWDLEAARRLGALAPAGSWRQIGEGWGLHYGTPGRNDDHVEFALGEPDSAGVCEHAGGGRPENAITLGKGDIRWSCGRPLLHAINPERMATNPATGDDPY